MEWVLVLVLMIGNQAVVTNIPGHKSEAACLATRANAVKAAAKQMLLTEPQAGDALISSFCVEKGK